MILDKKVKMWTHVASKGIIQDVFITLIFQDIIYKVKTAFISEFDAAYKQKRLKLHVGGRKM